MTARLPFLTSLWIAIVVALVSALAPLGPPLSRATGSAFNPATTGVVIKAGGPRRTSVQNAKPDDRRKSAVHASPMICLLLAVMLLCASMGGQRRAFAGPIPVAASGHASFLSCQQARAPPEPA